MQRVEAVNPALRWTELTVILTDDDGILPAQRACFEKEEPTDVISLRYDAAPHEAPGCTAEVILNVERAWAERRRGSASRELARYLAHGCNHLAGGRDHTPAQRAAMQRQDRAWLREAARHGLLHDLLQEQETPPDS